MTKYIENQEFFHIQRETNGLTVPLWTIGETHFIGHKKNRYVEYFDYYDARFHEGDATSLSSALFHTAKIIRELIFEEVRKEFFPSHPSRQRCLWVINQENTDSLEYWRNELGAVDKILKLRLTGKIHVANQTFLGATTENLNKIRQNAFHYWTGTNEGHNRELEILFEGFATVIEEIRP